MGIKDDLVAPYNFAEDNLPGLDFNRELHPPGTYEAFPEGVIGIRVDGDFWAVAALPWKYHETPIADIVRELWPQYINEATYAPDSNTIESRMHFANQWAKSQDQLTRLRAGRYDLHERHPIRHRALNDYFVRQYEHLLVAMAHEGLSDREFPGICKKCKLYMADSVHQQHYIALHNAGYKPRTLDLVDIPKDDN